VGQEVGQEVEVVVGVVVVGVVVVGVVVVGAGGSRHLTCNMANCLMCYCFDLLLFVDCLC
jgi:hypothetical protein